MGLFDKIKNALFEEEYVEVEEKPKKEKKVKPIKEKNNSEIKKEKPIAKKVVLPERDKVEDLHEEKLIDEDFEVPVKKENENRLNEFKMIDDNDLQATGEYRLNNDIIDLNKENKYTNEEEVLEVEEPEIVGVIQDDVVSNKNYRDYRDYSYDYDNTKDKEVEKDNDKDKEYVNNHYKNDYLNDFKGSRDFYQEVKNVDREKQPYGIDENSKVKIHEYGGYEKKEEKTGFKPSPIISPIYGVLDKNYKKEDVVTKKEVRLTSTYSRGKVSVDDVRNKAYGTLSDEVIRSMETEEDETSKFDVLNKEEENILVDLTQDSNKPSVKEVTVGDAVEYFQDLGLEYNVDYVDASKEKATGRRVKDTYEEENTNNEQENKEIKTVKEEKVIVEKKEEVVENEKKDTIDIDIDSDDNLFDLIDSMYQEN